MNKMKTQVCLIALLIGACGKSPNKKGDAAPGGPGPATSVSGQFSEGKFVAKSQAFVTRYDGTQALILSDLETEYPCALLSQDESTGNTLSILLREMGDFSFRSDEGDFFGNDFLVRSAEDTIITGFMEDTVFSGTAVDESGFVSGQIDFKMGSHTSLRGGFKAKKCELNEGKRMWVSLPYGVTRALEGLYATKDPDVFHLITMSYSSVWDSRNEENPSKYSFRVQDYHASTKTISENFELKDSHSRLSAGVTEKVLVIKGKIVPRITDTKHAQVGSLVELYEAIGKLREKVQTEEGVDGVSILVSQTIGDVTPLVESVNALVADKDLQNNANVIKTTWNSREIKLFIQ